MITVSEALEVVLRHTARLPSEDGPLAETLGRVLAEDVRADADLPPFDRAAMDGYAVRAADAGAAPVTLRVAGQVRAGEFPERGPAAGEAIQIMTGAPLPPGADAVQQVEKTRCLAGDTVELLAPVEPGQNVARRGSEVRAGEIVLRAGLAIDPSAIAVLAAVGQARVRVGRRPRVAVLVTGDELVDVGDTPAPGRIRNSNGPTLEAMARLAGAEVVRLGVAPDEPQRLASAVTRGLDGTDALVISGGVSAGTFDLVEPALQGCGVRVHFDAVAVKPGAPLVFGTRGATLVFGLPGNPVSAQVTFELFARPALRRMQGASALARPRVEVELLAPLRNKSGREAYLPARVRFDGGRFLARPVRSMGSADVRAHAAANALVVLGADRTEAAAGERAPALLLGGFLEGEAAPEEFGEAAARSR